MSATAFKVPAVSSASSFRTEYNSNAIGMFAISKSNPLSMLPDYYKDGHYITAFSH